MRAKLVPVGNSKGIRLPKALLAAAGLEDEVTLRVQNGTLVIAPARRRRRPRAGWAEAFRKEIQLNGPDRPDVDWEATPNEWDGEGWQW
jgi:antitoxin MazE